MKPLLVVVSGMPGSGKTTLSTHMAERLFLPLVAKDAIKESLCRTAGMPADRAASKAIGIRAIGVMHELTALHLDRGVGLVLEAAFVRGVSEPEVRPHLGRSCAMNVHCTVPADVALARYEDRAATSVRHPSHHDAAVLDETGITTWVERYGILPLGIPCLEVDTTDGYEPSIDAIVSWLEAQRASGE